MSADFFEVFDLEDLLKIWTCWVLATFLPPLDETYVELPALHMFSCVLACYDYDELRDLPSDHPFVELGHDLLYVRFDLVVG